MRGNEEAARGPAGPFAKRRHHVNDDVLLEPNDSKTNPSRQRRFSARDTSYRRRATHGTRILAATVLEQ
jgi:hypothetical protein